jgi:hypothetical protein
MAPDRRKPPARRQAALFVGSEDERLPFARSRDLSMSGVFLETDGRPPVGEQFEISIAWGDNVFSCEARVVRHARDGVGLLFLEPDTFFEQAVEEILSSSPPVDVVPGE